MTSGGLLSLFQLTQLVRVENDLALGLGLERLFRAVLGRLVGVGRGHLYAVAQVQDGLLVTLERFELDVGGAVK